MSSVPEPFSYNSALFGRRIRLLRVSPSSGDNALHLSLSEEELDNDTPYLALSYVWGSPEPTKTVICNEKALKITENLHAALWQMREDGRTGYIWADAVCINQEDVREKTEQVRLMSYIYERAEMVLIWLGEGEKHDQEGYALMARLCEQGAGTRSTPQLIEELSRGDAFPAMLSLLRRPWFWRAWVVQEYLMARKKIFQSGNLIMAPELFLGMVVRLIQDYNMANFIQLIYAASVESGYFFGPVFNFHGWVRGHHLSTLLAHSGALKSSDKRDRIFALVGLSSSMDLSLIDYELHLQDILIRVAKGSTQKILEGAEPWLVFDALLHINTPGCVENLPSWVPDYELPTPFRKLTNILEWGTPPDTAPQVELTADNTMVILGRIFDRISRTIQDDISDQVELPPDLISKRYLAWESSARGLAESISIYPTGQNIQEAYLRSLVFNHPDLDDAKASSGIQACFNAWMKCKAIDILYCEQHSGTFVPESFEDVISHLKHLAPDIDWQHTFKSIPAVTDSRMLDELMKHMDQCNPDQMAFSKPISYYSPLRRYFASDLGYLGWVPRSAQEGDRICVFYGCRFPFVIRPKGHGFQLIGACFMHGIMEGEAIKLWNTEGDERDISITLV